MKRVLITGANSYVGTNVEKWLMKEPDKFYVETLDMQDPNWKDFDFSGFDVVFHVAGIAHVSTKKKMKDLYFKVNRDLAIETAEKAKDSGVSQFIFMSSMIVYNSKETRITKDTVPNPDNFYGESKLQAETGIQKLQNKRFIVSILRPPMIYGPNSKGNFQKLIKYCNFMPIFPKNTKYKSALYIDNLCLFIKNILESNKSGVYFPQNKEFFKISQIVLIIRKHLGKNTLLLTWLNGLIYILIRLSIKARKIFGMRIYDIKLSSYSFHYQLVDFEYSLECSIKKGETII